MRGARIFAGWVVLLGGCSLFGSEPDDGIDDEPPITPPEGLTGDRGEGKFNYFCVSDRDPACLSSYALPFPAAIVVGGRFGLMYATAGGETLSVFSGSPTRISGFGASTFEALVPGSTGMLAYDYPDGGGERIIDFLSLTVEVPESVVLRRNEADVTAMTLDVGNEALVIAVSRDFLDEDPAGTLKFEWTLEPATGAAEILEQMEGGVRIRADGPGDATITARLGELSAAASIHVTGEAATTDPSTSEPTTGGSTGGTTTSATDSGETTAGETTSGDTSTGETTGTTTGSTTDMTTGDTGGTTGTTGGLVEERP